jgi:hypothetical protein
VSTKNAKILAGRFPAKLAARVKVCQKPHPLLPAGGCLLRLLEFFHLFNQCAYLVAFFALYCLNLRSGFRNQKRVGTPVLCQKEIVNGSVPSFVVFP